jgi:hypothetical protein
LSEFAAENKEYRTLKNACVRFNTFQASYDMIQLKKGVTQHMWDMKAHIGFGRNCSSVSTIATSLTGTLLLSQDHHISSRKYFDTIKV